MQATARAKFSETVELQLVLGTDPKRGDHAVRGTATLPHGTGKIVRVAVFAEGSSAAAARAAGDHSLNQAWTAAR
jgi:large subunit ribosomal protein L1